MSELKNLKSLYLQSCNITDISSLKDLAKLSALFIDDNKINDITHLDNFLTNLKEDYLFTFDYLTNNLNSQSKSLLARKYKPLLLIKLEKEKFEDSVFYKVSIDEIFPQNDGSAALYSIDKDGNIVGLYMKYYVLEKIKPVFASYAKNELSKLTHLCISGDNYDDTKTSDISFLKDFINIEKLDLSSNEIKDISILSNLTNLKSIILSYNQISDISPLSKMINLETIWISNNQISNISPLSKQISLKEILLDYNQISDISPLSKLIKLRKLNLENNQISNISPLSKLINLKEILLEDNQISDISPLSKLINLETIWISNNQISDISILSNLVNSIDIEFDDNQVKNIKPIINLRKLKSIHFSNNPLEFPPIEIAEQGIGAIKNYFSQIQKVNEADYLFEAKLILLGEERAGKSTIAKALIQENFKINLFEQSTEGIEILKWSIPKALTNTDKNFHFNIWDFGGQEIYHTTHQFFLTRRSLYLFISEARKDLRFDDFYYWLNIINSLAEDSPIIVIQNKCEQSSLDT